MQVLYVLDHFTITVIITCIGLISLFNTRFLLIPTMKFLNIRTVCDERWGSEKGEKVVINDFWIKSVCYHLSFLYLLIAGFTAFQIDIDNMMNADWTKGAYVGFFFMLRSYYPRFRATWKMLSEYPLAKGDSLTIGGHHGVFDRGDMSNVHLVNPRNDDRMYIPLRDVIEEVIVNHGPYGKTEEQKTRLEPETITEEALKRAKVLISRRACVNDKIAFEKVDLIEDNTLLVTYKVKDIECVERDLLRADFDAECITDILDSGLRIGTPY